MPQRDASRVAARWLLRVQESGRVLLQQRLQARREETQAEHLP